jgi:glutamate-1-semialdehyde 2,1-aminomutase
VVIPFNDPQRALTILEAHKSELACVLLDLMPHRVGLNPAEPEFVSALRDWTRNNDVVLLLDEVITFRSAYGGMQADYHLTPDLTALGKVIGGGFPVGAIVGRADVMDVMNPRAARLLFPHSGTFSANPVTMNAGLTAMKLFNEAAIERLNGLAERARHGIEAAIRSTSAQACVTGYGSMFRVHLKADKPRNYREAFMTAEENRQLRVLLDHLFENGLMMINTCSATLSTAMGEAEIDQLVSHLQTGFEKLVAEKQGRES